MKSLLTAIMLAGQLSMAQAEINEFPAHPVEWYAGNQHVYAARKDAELESYCRDIWMADFVPFMLMAMCSPELFVSGGSDTHSE